MKLCDYFSENKPFISELKSLSVTLNLFKASWINFDVLGLFKTWKKEKIMYQTLPVKILF